MVEPSKKRSAIRYLKEHYNAGLKRIAGILSLSHSSYYYQSKMDDIEVIDKLKELIRIKPNRGIDYYYRRSRREGCTWSRDKMLRGYRE